MTPIARFVLPLLLVWMLPDPSVCPTYDHGDVHEWEYERTDNLAQTAVSVDTTEAQQLEFADPPVGHVTAWTWPDPYDAAGHHLFPECHPTPVSVDGVQWEGM